MIPLFGAHYRLYRMQAALDRLNKMPAGARLPLAKAAHLLGTSEATVRRLVQRYAPGTSLADNAVGAAALRHILRQAHAARKR